MARRVLEMLQFGFKYEWKKRYKPKYNSQCTTILISEKKKMHRNKSDSALTLANLIGCFLILCWVRFVNRGIYWGNYNINHLQKKRNWSAKEERMSQSRTNDATTQHFGAVGRKCRLSVLPSDSENIQNRSLPYASYTW